MSVHKSYQTYTLGSIWSRREHIESKETLFGFLNKMCCETRRNVCAVQKMTNILFFYETNSMLRVWQVHRRGSALMSYLHSFNRSLFKYL